MHFSYMRVFFTLFFIFFQLNSLKVRKQLYIMSSFLNNQEVLFMLKVLIIDDEVKVCRLIQCLINWKELGLEVIGTCHDGFLAMDAIRLYMPDIIITDIRMLVENPLCISSRANIIPARGAWNAAASPALAPHVIRWFSSVFPRSSILDTP